MSGFKVGDRVAVRPEYDELRKLAAIIPGFRTQPGVVIDIFTEGHDVTYVVAEDNEDGPGGGSSAPYREHELEAE